MGLKDIIPFLKDKYHIRNVLTPSVPEYRMHPSRHEVLKALRPPEDQNKIPRSIHDAPQEYVSSTGPEEIVIHLDTSSKRVVIEDWMLALRAPRKIAQSMGYKYTGTHFYDDLIRPVMAYWKIDQIQTIILVVDKGSPPEKKKCQEKRQAARDRTAELKKERLEALGAPEGETKTKKRKEPDKPTEAVEDYPANIQITDEGIVLPGLDKVVNLDAARLMSSKTPGLRFKLYSYLCQRMTQDDRLFKVVNGEIIYARIIFDFDLEGPWMIRNQVSTRLPQFKNTILEADNACFWWGARQPTFDVFIHAGDTDYLAIALMNEHRFHRSLMIQIRDNSRDKAICMEAHYARYLLAKEGVGEQEFALGCIMNGTDYVTRTDILYYVGPVFVWQGLELYRGLRNLMLPSSGETSGASSKAARASALNKSLRKCIGDNAAAEAAMAAPSRIGTTWPMEITSSHYGNQGLDAVLCCIYIRMYQGKGKRKDLIQAMKDLDTGALTLPDPNSVISRFYRPALLTLRNETKSTDMDEDDEDVGTHKASKTGKKQSPTKKKKLKMVRGLPRLPDKAYIEALEMIKFNFDYWRRLGM